jgi:hypothetical protein
MVVAGALVSSLTPAQAATAATAATAAKARPATAVPPAPSSSLAGTWVNTNKSTNSIVDIVVATTSKSITVDAFGSCEPTLCQYGKIAGTVFGSSVSAKTGTTFAAEWNFGFDRAVFVATYSTPKNVPTLTVQEFTTFTDTSGRANFLETETFHKGKAVKATLNGTAGTGYPAGNLVIPVASLAGIWINLHPTGNLVALILTPEDGTIAVHAFADCSPDPCDWGSVNAVTFGTSISSTSGRSFLAPFSFSFANKLLDGTINTAGTELTVHTLTEFTDHSGRSNYESTDTFVPLR